MGIGWAGASRQQTPPVTQRPAGGAALGGVGGEVTVSLQDMTNRAELVLVGVVTEVAAAGPTSIVLGGSEYPADLNLASVQVERTLKGTAPAALVVEVRNSEDLDYRPVQANTRRVFFLVAGSRGRYVFVNENLRTLPGAAGAGEEK